jgi:surfeit locus 1 family protein
VGRYAFARSPRWIATHVLIVVLVVTMVSLGFWQLRRLDERRDRNALIEAQMRLPPEDVGEVVASTDDVDDLRFRSVTADGEYAADAVVAVRTNQEGAPGEWVFSLLELDGGDRVVVLRGFAGTQVSGALDPPAPPDGEVEVDGIMIAADRLPRTARQAVADLEEDLGPFLPVVVQASEPDSDRLLVVPVPEQDDGPHLSYAVQWFLFATVVAVGYPFLLRRRARS